MFFFLLMMITVLAGGQQINGVQAVGSYYHDKVNEYNENYHPNYLLDDNPSTSWTLQAEQKRKSAKIFFAPVRTAYECTIWVKNGNQKNQKSYVANGSARRLDLFFRNYEGRIVAFHQLDLAKTSGWQKHTIPFRERIAFASIELEVKSFHRGKNAKLIAISDVKFSVRGSRNSAEEQEKIAENLIQWTKNRQKEAQDAQENNLWYPFAANVFEGISVKEISFADSKRQNEPFMKKRQSLKTDPNWYSRDFTATLPSWPEGINDYSHHLLPVFHPQKLWLWPKESKYSFLSDIERKISSGYPTNDVKLSNYKIERYPNGKLKHLYFELIKNDADIYACEMKYEEILVSYDKNERMTDIFVYGLPKNDGTRRTEKRLRFLGNKTKQKIDTLQEVILTYHLEENEITDASAAQITYTLHDTDE